MIIKKLQDKYHNNDNQDTLDEHWRKIQTTIKNVATESIATKNNKDNQKEWYDKECRKLNLQKTEARNRLFNQIHTK